MDTNLYWTVRGKYDERKKKLAEMEREVLEASILDGQYNDFVSDRADYAEDEKDEHGHGKRVPYVGWYWRHIEFSTPKAIPIGDCGSFVGFMANNKWDYPERRMTEEEARGAVAIIDAAIEESEKGGESSEIRKKTNEKLDELWAYMQTIKI